MPTLMAAMANGSAPAAMTGRMMIEPMAWHRPENRPMAMPIDQRAFDRLPVMRVVAAFAEQDGERHPRQGYDNARKRHCAELFAEEKPAENDRENGVGRKQNAGAARAEAVHGGEKGGVAGENADEAGDD